MTIRRMLFAVALATVVSMTSARAEPVIAAGNALDVDTATMPASQANSASLTHSAIKATTYKVGTTAVNFAILSVAAGGMVGGAALAAIALGASWTLYTANDYLWDTYSPAPARLAGQSFDASADAWRNTKKFMTYKPLIASFKYASLFVYTGSLAVAAGFGTATVVANTAVFYANNMAWDWIDWYMATPVKLADRPM